ncbi:MAG: hypothetical protein E7313_03895 [Clostridiales bacterium]|nr:hypothetical protein [Clostridiales bacterium]
MNLIDESRNTNRNNKKLFTICGIGIITLIVIIISLLLYLVIVKKNNKSMVVDSAKYNISSYLIEKDNVVYIGIEDLVKISKSGYTYKSGTEDVEDFDKCYVTNGYESTFFEVGSDEISKVLVDTKNYEYYKLKAPIIKENEKIYMPIENCDIAMNCSYNTNNGIVINSIAYIESCYNREKKGNFVPNDSIVWNTSYSNKKLLKNGVVVTMDSTKKLGLSTISSQTDKKTKITTVNTKILMDHKYKSIDYIEQYKQLVVETENGKGIVQLDFNNDEIKIETVIKPQFEDIKPIGNNLYIVTSKNENESKYGIVLAKENNENTLIVPIEYDEIGIKNTSNIKNSYILYDSLIPVKKNNLYGFVNLKGNIVIKLEYSNIGCVNNVNDAIILIPEVEGIVVNKGGKYGIISKSGKELAKNVLSKIYKEVVNGKEQYSLMYNDKKYELNDFIKNVNTNINTNTNTITDIPNPPATINNITNTTPTNNAEKEETVNNN